MAKHLTHPKVGIGNLIEQTFFKLFTPVASKTKSDVSFIATPTAEVTLTKATNHAAEVPADKPKQRIKKESTFSLHEAATPIKSEVKAKPEYAEIKPEIKLKHTGFNVAVNFANNFKLPAKIYSRRGFEKDFKFLAMDTFSPYMDNRPKLDSSLTEEREYKVIFIDDEMEVGQMSEIVKISI